MAERVAGGPTVARWESWDGTALQHLVLRVGPEEIVAVPSAPGAARVRVWPVMSRGRDPSTGHPPPEGVYVAYPPSGGRLCCLSSRERRGDPGAFCPLRPATSDHQGRRPYRLSVYRALPSRGTFPHSSAASGGGCDASTTFSYFLFNLTSY